MGPSITLALVALLVSFAPTWVSAQDDGVGVGDNDDGEDPNQQSLQQQHVSNFELLTRAGYFRSGMYCGGVPSISRQGEWYDCRVVWTENTTASAGLVLAPVCSYWITSEYSPSEDAFGDCFCIRKSANLRYCDAYQCQQTVNQQQEACDDNVCSEDVDQFGKYKDCNCLTPNETNSDYCDKWTCLGYGDGPVKTMNWQCNIPASQVSPGSTEVEGWAVGTYKQDFCWEFQSDEFSPITQAAKDCVCEAVGLGGGYCQHWTCAEMSVSTWPWWAPLVTSIFTACFNGWFPCFMYSRPNERLDDLGLGLLCIIIIISVGTILLGGVVSLVINMGIILVGCIPLIVQRSRCTCPPLCCSGSSSIIAPPSPFATANVIHALPVDQAFVQQAPTAPGPVHTL